MCSISIEIKLSLINILPLSVIKIIVYVKTSMLANHLVKWEN